MLESYPVMILVGSILGFLAGLGIGGGSLLILWLTIVLGMDHITARGINLLFFLPTALIATLFRWKQGTVPWRKIFPAIVCGCIASGIFSFFAGQMELTVLKKLFGGLLLLTGLRELFYRRKD